MKLIQKYSFFFNFVATFWDKGGNLVIRKVQRGVIMFQKNWRNSPSKPREIGFFSF